MLVGSHGESVHGLADREANRRARAMRHLSTNVTRNNKRGFLHPTNHEALTSLETARVK